MVLSHTARALSKPALPDSSGCLAELPPRLHIPSGYWRRRTCDLACSTCILSANGFRPPACGEEITRSVLAGRRAGRCAQARLAPCRPPCRACCRRRGHGSRCRPERRGRGWRRRGRAAAASCLMRWSWGAAGLVRLLLRKSNFKGETRGVATSNSSNSRPCLLLLACLLALRPAGLQYFTRAAHGAPFEPGREAPAREARPREARR